VSKKEIQKFCECCKCSYLARRHRQRFCSKNCQYEWTRKPIVKRTSVDCCICKKTLTRKVNDRLGEKSYCSDCFKTKRIGHKLTERHKKRISETRLKDWASGVYRNAVVGTTKWHDHIKPDGTKIRCQGTWELLYAKFLDDQKINYECHIGALRYVNQKDGKEHVYLPDFFLVDCNQYIDIKNDYLLKLDSEKIESVKKCNPQINLKIITKQDLIALKILKN